MKYMELSRTMNALGISDENVETLSNARSKIRTALKEAPKTSNWSPKKAFSVLLEAKKEDDRKRQALLRFYATAEALLDEMDEQMLSLLQKHFKNLKPKMRWHKEQLKQTKYFLLVAGEMSSGKSSLINLILGEVILPFADIGTTSTICELKFGRKKEMVAHFKEKDPETGHEIKTIPFDEQTGYQKQISNYVHKKGSIYRKVELFWPHELLKTGLVIIDSPGVGDSDEMDNMVIQYLPEAFAFIYVANSSLRGGVQKDKLEKLFQEARYVSIGVPEEEKDESSEWVDIQEELLSKCVLFVCNKWDQLNENLGTESVKDEITKKLKKAWPGVDPDSQIIYMSTKHAFIAQDLGFISNYFSALMDKMRSLVLRRIQAKHELHWGWLDKLLSRIFFQAKAHVVNTSASPKEIKKRLDKIVRRLEAIEEDQEKVIKDLRKTFREEVDRVVQRLSEHLSSKDVKERFTSWSLDEAPAMEGSWTEVEEKVNTLLSRRFQEIVDQLEEEHEMFAIAHHFLMQQFQNYYDDVEFKLQNLQSDDTEFESGKTTFRFRISTFQKCRWVVEKSYKIIRLVLAVSLPVMAVSVQLLAGVNDERPSYQALLSNASEEILADCTNKTKLKPFVEEKLKDAKLYLDRIEARLPEMIKADRDLYEQLTKEKDELSRYQPVFLKVSKHRNELALFGLTEVCAESMDCKKLEWKEEESSCLGHGSFGAVYQEKMRGGDGKVTTVALKVWKEALDVNNAVKIMEETKNLRLLESPHIVQFYGISLVKDTLKLKTVLVMEKCKTDLKHYIFRELKSPPSRSKDPALFDEVCRWAKQITDGLAYIHEKGIGHRDLKLENILLSEDNSVKIADVGLAKAAIDITGTLAGTPVYMAPEVFHSQVYDTKADIYSLGLIMWEMWYGHPVFADALGTPLQAFFDWVDKGNRPVEMHGCQTPPSFWERLMTQCWDGNPKKRPTAKECHERMVCKS